MEEIISQSSLIKVDRQKGLRIWGQKEKLSEKGNDSLNFRLMVMSLKSVLESNNPDGLHSKYWKRKAKVC